MFLIVDRALFLNSTELLSLTNHWLQLKWIVMALGQMGMYFSVNEIRFEQSFIRKVCVNNSNLIISPKKINLCFSVFIWLFLCVLEICA